MNIPKPDSTKANAPYDPIVHRTTWIYRAILGLLAIMCVSLLTVTSQLHHNVSTLQNNVNALTANSVASRTDRSTYQDDQRLLVCQIAATLKTPTTICNPDGTARVEGSTQNK